MLSLKSLLDASPWARTLSPPDLARVEAETLTRMCAPGALVCRKGEAVEAWVGVIDGLVKMANVSPDGKPTSFVGMGPGAWFGEGSLLKDEPRRYDIVALRESSIAYMPRATFMWLLDTSMPFNRFLITQLNERLGQFIGMVEHDRLLGPDARLARCLAGMFNPHLYPGIRRTLQISQEEVAQLAGLLRIEYGGVTVTNLDGPRDFED